MFAIKSSALDLTAMFTYVNVRGQRDSITSPLAWLWRLVSNYGHFTSRTDRAPQWNKYVASFAHMALAVIDSICRHILHVVGRLSSFISPRPHVWRAQHEAMM